MKQNPVENNFDIKLNNHFKLYVLFRHKILFESELEKNHIKYYSEMSEQPLIDGGIRYFLLESDAQKIDKIIIDNEIIANTESPLLTDFIDYKKAIKLYIFVGVILVIFILLILSIV